MFKIKLERHELKSQKTTAYGSALCTNTYRNSALQEQKIESIKLKA